MAVRLKEQIVKEHEKQKSFCFLSDSTPMLRRVHSSHCKQPVYFANQVAEILETTDVSQWKQKSGINNPADSGTGAINIEELKISDWLNKQAW